MDSTSNGAPRRPNPRRRKRSRVQRYIRAYAPLAGILLLIVLFIVFAVGSVRRANERREQERLESLAVEESLAKVRQELEQEAIALVEEADLYAASCEFEKAVEVLDRFTGDPDEFEVIVAARRRYETGEETLVSVEDVTKIPCLSFSKLIMSAEEFSEAGGDSKRYSYITTAEFTRILQELYENNFMLVDLYDIFTTSTNDDGTTQILKNDLRMPAGKKPILLVHAHAPGYTNQLIVDENGNIQSKVTQEDSSYTGSYDFVPLLEDFIRSNPGFSYKGARAVLGVSGYKGVFGYPITETASIATVVEALKEKGYTIACNSFANVGYGMESLADMVEDVSNFNVSVTPLVGATEALVFARNSDLSDGKDAYRGTKYEKLYEAGFKYYFGICYSSTPWMNVTDDTVRIGRILVTGNNLIKSPSLFGNLFVASEVVETQ